MKPKESEEEIADRIVKKLLPALRKEPSLTSLQAPVDQIAQRVVQILEPKMASMISTASDNNKLMDVIERSQRQEKAIDFSQ